VSLLNATYSSMY